VHVRHLKAKRKERDQRPARNDVRRGGTARQRPEGPADLEDLERAVIAEAEGKGRGLLDAGRGGVGVRVQHGGEVEEEQGEEAGE
jgi:hypothetical protein